jgi:MFS family permease
MTRIRVLFPVLLDYLLAYVGFFSLLPVLPVLIGRFHPETGALYLGVALFVFSFFYKGGSLFLTRLLNRLPVRTSMAGGLVVAAVGFELLSLGVSPAATIACLVLAGLGVSVNALMARVYVAVALSEPSARNSAFAAIHVILNVAGAIGPIIANLLVGAGWSTPLVHLIAAGYLLSALVAALTVPAGLSPNPGDARKPISGGVLRTMVRDPGLRWLSIVTAVGGFLYGQFFSALSLHIVRLTESSALRASFFTLNAILVVALQIPVSALTNRGLNRGVAPLRYLAVGVLLFAATFATLGAVPSSVVVTYAAIALFSLAETFFTPLVNTAYAATSGELPVVEAFTMRQVAATAGESLGAFAGGALYLWAAGLGIESGYWLLVAALGLAVPVAQAWFRLGARPVHR